MGSNLGRTGRVSLPYRSTPNYRQTTPPQVLCTYQADKARALTLMLSASAPGSPSPVPVAFSLPCNLGSDGVQGITTGVTGVVLLEYGAGSARNYAVADLRPGSYALPPCEFAQISINAFHPLATASNPMPGIEVGGTLLEGQHKQAARFTASLIGTVDAGGDFFTGVPAHARWVDVEGGSIGAAGTITPAKVRFREAVYRLGPPGAWVGAGRYIVRDEAAGVFPDPMPVELASSGFSGATPGSFQVWNDAATEAEITVKFFLEL